MNADEKLDAIAALCDESRSIVRAADVRAVLDAPSVPAARAGGIDRNTLLTLGYEYLDPYGIDGQPTEHARRVVSEFADRILALVQPAPPTNAPEWELLDLCRRFVAAVRSVGYVEIEGLPLDDVERRLDAATRDAAVQPAPPALDLGVVRRILTAALPADPKWAVWVEGRIDEIAKAVPSEGVVLSPDEAERVSGALRWIDEFAPVNVRLNSHAKEIAARLEAAS